MKRITKLATIIILCMTASFAKAQEYSVASPDGKIKVTVSLGDGITYDVHYGNELVLAGCRISLDINGKVLGSAPSLKSVNRKSADRVKRPFLHLKYAEVPDRFNQMTLKMKGGYSVEFRAYDDGIAYRFVTDLGAHCLLIELHLLHQPV